MLLPIVVLVVVVLAASSVLTVRRVSSGIVFQPNPRAVTSTPDAEGLGYDDVWLTTSDEVRVHAWHVKVGSPRAIVVLFHGNAGTITGRIGHAKTFASHGLETLLVEYRGYGESSGVPSERGLYLDAAAAVAWARDHQLPLVIYGESLGGAVAVRAAIDDPPDLLVLQSTFTSIGDIASGAIPLGRFLVAARFASIDRVAEITAPTIVVHGDGDDMIPYAMGIRLFDAITAPKTMLTIEGAMHNDAFVLAGDRIVAAIADALVTKLR